MDLDSPTERHLRLNCTSSACRPIQFEQLTRDKLCYYQENH